ncbi:MAG: HAMP domain-containing protein [Burkholderiaceae bacterium]|nr:HAMP domain-containing protein [Burkholderiaceae bacterium]
MSLRLQLNLILATLITAFTALLVLQQVEDTRRSVREEVEAASIVASQVLTRVGWIYEQAGVPGMVQFLRQLGHVRGNDISLYDDNGQLIYSSPGFTYKAGREAPGWFSRLVSPPTRPTEIELNGGRLVLKADASRSVLDGWDDLVKVVGGGVVGLAGAIALAYFLTGRALRPLRQVVEGLRRIGAGDYSTRLPTLPGQEARSIGEAFNRMAQVVQDSVEARRAAAEAEADLAQSRELTQIIQTRIEQERAAIARELHDELGQQVTAIKSAGVSIAQRVRGQDPALEQASRLVVDTASQIYGVVHQIIARMRPLPLDHVGLAEALNDLLGDWRLQHPQVEFSLDVQKLPPDPGETLSTAAYRIVQEAVNNALRHGAPTRVQIQVRVDGVDLSIRVADNGRGLPVDWRRPGHYGVLGMRERAVALGGSFELQRSEAGGVCVSARIPLQAEAMAAA